MDGDVDTNQDPEPYLNWVVGLFICCVLRESYLYQSPPIVHYGTLKTIAIKN